MHKPLKFDEAMANLATLSVGVAQASVAKHIDLKKIAPGVAQKMLKDADILAAQTKVSEHLRAPAHAAPYDLMQPWHNALETSSLLGSALKPAKDAPLKGFSARVGAFGAAASARSYLNVPFAAIDVVTLRSLHKNQAADARAPWKTWALPVTVPVWLVSQAAAVIGAVAKTALLAVATAVRLGVMVGSFIVRGSAKTVDGFKSFFIKETLRQTLKQADLVKEEKSYAQFREQAKAAFYVSNQVLKSTLEDNAKHAAAAQTEGEKYFFAAEKKLLLAVGSLLGRAEKQLLKPATVKGDWLNHVERVPVDTLLIVARKTDQILKMLRTYVGTDRKEVLTNLLVVLNRVAEAEHLIIAAGAAGAQQMGTEARYRQNIGPFLQQLHNIRDQIDMELRFSPAV